jgi:sulfur-oxidizing protein SoxY
MQRRDFLKKISTAVAVSAVVPVMSFAGSAKGKNDMSFKVAVDTITGGKTPQKSEKVHLKAPEIAENGAVVPITVNVDSPMTDSDYVKAIHILNGKNGNARCIDVQLTPDCGKAMFSTRIKLGGTQDVTAIVELSNGSFLMAAQSVKVTIGGCG